MNEIKRQILKSASCQWGLKHLHTNTQNKIFQFIFFGRKSKKLYRFGVFFCLQHHLFTAFLLKDGGV